MSETINKLKELANVLEGEGFILRAALVSQASKELEVARGLVEEAYKPKFIKWTDRHNDEFTVEATLEKKDEAFRAIIGWIQGEGHWHGEALIQSDSAIISAPEFLAYLVDEVIKVDVKSDEDD